MKTRITLLVMVALAIVACDKDKFETVPQLKYISRNTDIVPVGGDLRLLLEYTDKEGDVSDSIFVVRQRLNARGPLQLPASPYNIPDFPHTPKGQFEITLDYQFGLVFGMPPIPLPGNKREIDTLNLKIIAKDNDGNKSDTLIVSNVYVTR